VSAAAINRLALFFECEPTRPGILARRALGHDGAEERQTAQRAAERLRAELRADGSLSGGALPTVWRAHEILDLSQQPDVMAPTATIHWILALQEKPGAFGEGCDKARHAQRVCEHFAGGFFSPGPRDHRFAPVTFPNGKAFRAEPAARFALSCLALRVALRAGHGSRPAVQRHLASLVALSDQWTDWNGDFPPDAIASGLHALAQAWPPEPQGVASLVALFAAHQAPDGGWPHAHLFHTLDALLAVDSADARTVIRRAVPALLDRQRGDGSFGPAAQQERALIGLRALLRAEGGM
jgi:hypothetical protein